MLYVFFLHVFLIPMETLRERLPHGPTGINYQNVMVVLLIGWLLYRRFSLGAPLRLPSALDVPLAAYLALICGGMIITLQSFPGSSKDYPGDSLSLNWGRPFEFYSSFLLFWVAAACLDSRRKIHLLLLVLALEGLIISRHFYIDVMGSLGDHYSHEARRHGPFRQLDANHLAAFFLYWGLFFFLYSFGVQSFLQKVLFWIVAFMYGWGVLFTFSRGSWLALAVALVLLTVIRYRWAIVPIGLAVATSAAWLPQQVVERATMTVDEEGQLDDSAAARERYWARALEAVPESPIIGHGVGSFALGNPTRQEAHNLYIQTLYESGFVGLGLLMVIWLIILRVAFVLWRQAPDPFDRHYGFALFIATIALMITNYFGDRFHHAALIGQYWVLVGAGFRLYSDLQGASLLEDTVELEHEEQWATG